MRLILGSASPRRAHLLRRLGAVFDVRSADVDESALHGEAPDIYVQRVAQAKLDALLKKGDPAAPGATLLLTADTTVAIGGEILVKPEGREDAYRMLKRLSGQTHTVFTALCLIPVSSRNTRPTTMLVRTEVDFTELSDKLIVDYLATDEPWDKAGAYAIQGLGGSFVREIRGSVSNVIGLPLVETRELLQGAGLPMTVASSSINDTTGESSR